MSVKRYFFLLLLLAPFTLNQSLAQGVTPDHIANMKTVVTGVISSDGKYVAYLLATPADPVKENLPSRTHLYMLNTVTGESRPWHTSSSVSGVAFRPGKNSVTFISKENDDKVNSIYEMSLSGGGAVKIFTATSSIMSYTWHPNGNHMAYVIKESAKAPETPLAFKPDFFEESFGEQKCLIVDVGGSKKESITVNTGGSAYQLNFSPDGSRLALSVATTASVDDSYMQQQVKVADTKTGNIIATIENEGKLGGITWSPDGTRLALNAALDLNDPTNGSILIVSSNGGKPTVIDAQFKGKYEQLQWTAANTIHYLASESTASTIGTITPDGKVRQVLFNTGVHHITGFDRSTSGTIAFFANSPEHSTELFTLANKKGATPVRRTQSNEWLKELKLGKQEVIKYKTRDGKYEIEGMLIYPLNYTAGTRVPLITVVHGGPESHYGNGWLTGYSMPGQMAAAKGYAVFLPNYRGSTGRGTEFTYSSQGDAAGKEFDDIVDGVDYMIEKGIADKNRIGVTGGSYGGYASAWMSTYYSDRFAAAVMFVGLSNKLSSWGTSDIPKEEYLVHSRKWIWDSWQYHLERSPIYYADRAQTPILIMAGSNDPRVHPTQSMELYRHLKVRKPDLPVRLIFYPGEGHGNTKSGSRYDYNYRMLQWFDTYLMTGNRKAALPPADMVK